MKRIQAAVSLEYVGIKAIERLLICSCRVCAPYLDAVQQVCVVVAVMVGVGSRQGQQVVVPGLGRLGVTVTPFGFQLGGEAGKETGLHVTRVVPHSVYLRVL